MMRLVSCLCLRDRRTDRSLVSKLCCHLPIEAANPRLGTRNTRVTSALLVFVCLAYVVLSAKKMPPLHSARGGGLPIVGEGGPSHHAISLWACFLDGDA